MGADLRVPRDNWYHSKRLAGLWRFALAISILNILGHSVLGFEQAWAQPVVGLATAYVMELGIETVDAWAGRRPPKFIGSPRTFVEFLLSAHITGLAVSMLIYSNERFWVTVFAVAVAIASKALFCAPQAIPGIPPGEWPTRHFLNPSNFGITVTLVAFPWVGIAPPYQFTENARGVFDVVLPLIIVASGSLLNTKLTERIPLIAAWLGGFVMQAVLRSLWNGLAPLPALAPMTGLAFVLFSFYMITDPGTTPATPRAQIIFGAAVAATYGVLVSSHVVFGLFFALTLVTLARGAAMHVAAWRTAAENSVAAPASRPS